MKRFEQKYLLDSVNINNVLKQIDAKPVYNSRWINSIYYDTKEFIFYNESVEGTVPRKKLDSDGMEKIKTKIKIIKMVL